MRHHWFIVDLVQLAQTIRGDEPVAIIHGQELGHFGIIRLGPVMRSWRAEFVIRAFTEVGRIIRKAMGEMDSRFDEVNVLTDMVGH